MLAAMPTAGQLRMRKRPVCGALLLTIAACRYPGHAGHVHAALLCLGPDDDCDQWSRPYPAGKCGKSCGSLQPGESWNHHPKASVRPALQST